MNENPFRNNFPQVFRLEYEVQAQERGWEKRWVVVVAQSLDEAWTSFPARLNTAARSQYEQGTLRLVSVSPALLLNMEYRVQPDFNMPVNGLPKTYYMMRGN